jgi:folate-dependent phosphoribosylglycinamide formyltransferase PurN
MTDALAIPCEDRPRTLIITRGDYITRLVADRLFKLEHDLLVVVVSCDSHGRTGLALLKALWMEYEWHYALYEMIQYGAFKVAGALLQIPLSVGRRARERKLRCLRVTNVNDPKVLAAAEAFAPDVLVSIICPQRIRPPLLDLPTRGSINVHPSLLPAFAGRAPHFWAMCKGEAEIGITAHRMTEEFDAGEILAQRRFRLRPGQSAFAALRRLGLLGGHALAEGICKLLRGEHGAPQNRQQRSYFKAPTPEAYARFRAQGRRLIRWRELFAVILHELRLARRTAGA